VDDADNQASTYTALTLHLLQFQRTRNGSALPAFSPKETISVLKKVTNTQSLRFKLETRHSHMHGGTLIDLVRLPEVICIGHLAKLQ
jgi:hypothetical protein